MFEKLFANTNYLEKGLDAAWTRNQVIVNNIANNDTPGFKSSRVDFETIFKSALENEHFSAKKTNDKHIDFSDDIDSITPVIVQNNSTSTRMDGNNVDVDYENAQLVKNYVYYNTLIEKMNSEFSQLRIAINEGK